MDYAELKLKHAYTDMGDAVAGLPPGYYASTDPVASEEDMDTFYRSTLADFRPDPRTLEEDQKQTITDSVAQLRFRYHGTRYGDDPDYHKEMMLSDTSKDPRRSFTDPDFRQLVKQGWSRQQYYKTNLYPDDPGTGSITQGTKSQFGQQLDALAAREGTKVRMAELLTDNIGDGTEPRRQFNRFDQYSYIDAALANQGDSPLVNPVAAQHEHRPMRAIAAAPDGAAAAAALVWTDGDVILGAALLGRGAAGRGHGLGPSAAAAATVEAARGAPVSDAMAAAPRGLATAVPDAVRLAVEDAVRAESRDGQGAGRGAGWGAAGEQVRAAMAGVQTQAALLAAGFADAANRAAAVGRDGTGGGAAGRLTAPDVADNSPLALLALFKAAAARKLARPMSGQPGQSAALRTVAQEVDQINAAWRQEHGTARARRRDPGLDDVRRAAGLATPEDPWVALLGTTQVANLRAPARRAEPGRDMAGQRRDAPMAARADDALGLARRAAVGGGDLAAGHAAAPTTAMAGNAAAPAGMQGGAAAPLGRKRVRFETAEAAAGLEDAYAVAEGGAGVD